jgi:hypothetical protein
MDVQVDPEDIGLNFMKISHAFFGSIDVRNPDDVPEAIKKINQGIFDILMESIEQTHKEKYIHEQMAKSRNPVQTGIMLGMAFPDVVEAMCQRAIKQQEEARRKELMELNMQCPVKSVQEIQNMMSGSTVTSRSLDGIIMSGRIKNDIQQDVLHKKYIRLTSGQRY